ncbi:MAG: aldehyde dehydrogenase [Balneolaceae bacterium]|nr:aldehyde dehydrogenase [Balneolaceae bacterium]
MKLMQLVKDQKAAFLDGRTRSLKSRESSLNQLRKLIYRHEKELCDAINEDFGKPYIESYITEIYTLLDEIDYHLKNLSTWIKPVSVGGPIVTFPSKNIIYQQPKGTILVIGAWNYPVHLSLMPLIGAISAGNTAILKPSELAPVTSAKLKELFDRYFKPEILAVAEGGVEETTELLEQPFDHIFFTGSSRVGKIVMKAAAENLTPVTLELGGKSPAIVHEDANIEVSVNRIWWGKTINAGQTCVAPDYVLVHKSIKEQFIQTSKNVLSSFFQNDFQVGKNYTRIVNDDHFNRLNELLNKSKVIHGGLTNKQSRFIEPTLIDANWEDEIMKEEIFGPLLPLLTYDDEKDIPQLMNSMSAPLALYMFTENKEFQDFIIENVPFGGGCVNDTISHLGNHNLPYGGTGYSGMGSYRGKYSFNTFSREQGILKKPSWPDPDVRYPPYNDTKLKWFKRLFIK